MNPRNTRMNNNINAWKRWNTLPDPHSFLDCKHLGIAVTHGAISGETMMCALHATLPSSLPRGLIVLEGFVGNMFIFEPGLTQDEETSHRYKSTVRNTSRILFFE
jgi:hypothetical protein